MWATPIETATPVPTEEPTLEPTPTDEPSPTPTEAPPPTATPDPPDPGELESGYATYYGLGYEAGTMGCGGTYRSYDLTILAVSPARYSDWPCGTVVEVCGQTCLNVTRQDSCPGCSANVLDLSDSANYVVCATAQYDYPHTCRVTFRVISRPQ